MTSETPGETSYEELVCDICGRVFDTVESLKEHKEAEIKEEALEYNGVD